LVAAANPEHDCAVGSCLDKRVSFEFEQVGCAAALILVLAASEVEQIEAPGIDLIADPNRRHIAADRAPAAAILEHGDVASVGIDVQLIGVEGRDSKRRFRH
jgi:hypothetical protein